jgi:hypothetical protein
VTSLRRAGQAADLHAEPGYQPGLGDRADVAADGSQGEATPQDPSNGYPYQGAGNESFYIRAASRSPYDLTSYLGTTSCRANGWPGPPAPRTGLCDAAAAFPPTQGQVLSQWINHTSCDSLHATAADADPSTTTWPLADRGPRPPPGLRLAMARQAQAQGLGISWGPYMVCARSSGAAGDLDKQLIRPEDRARGLSCAAWGNREAKPGAGRVDGIGVAMRACAWSITSQCRVSTGAQSGST